MYACEHTHTHTHMEDSYDKHTASHTYRPIHLFIASFCTFVFISIACIRSVCNCRYICLNVCVCVCEYVYIFVRVSTCMHAQTFLFLGNELVVLRMPSQHCQPGSHPASIAIASEASNCICQDLHLQLGLVSVTMLCFLRSNYFPAFNLIFLFRYCFFRSQTALSLSLAFSFTAIHTSSAQSPPIRPLFSTIPKNIYSTRNVTKAGKKSNNNKDNNNNHNNKQMHTLTHTNVYHCT